MDNTIELFNKRWNIVEKECLSSVRRQLSYPVFDISMVNNDLQKSCDEWFEGKLAAALWFEELTQSNPNKAHSFCKYVKALRLTEVKMSEPSKAWAYILTAVSLPITYLVTDVVLGWGLMGKIVSSIGISVLVWSASKVKTTSIHNNYEEMVVASIKKQLDEHYLKVKQIIS